LCLVASATALGDADDPLTQRLSRRR
jgi:hypothetical protein